MITALLLGVFVSVTLAFVIDLVTFIAEIWKERN